MTTRISTTGFWFRARGRVFVTGDDGPMVRRTSAHPSALLSSPHPSALLSAHPSALLSAHPSALLSAHPSASLAERRRASRGDDAGDGARGRVRRVPGDDEVRGGGRRARDEPT